MKTAAILRSRAFLAIASGYRGVYRDPVDADLSGRLHAGRPARRREHKLTLCSVARRSSRVRHLAKRLWRGSVGAAILSSVAIAGDALLPNLVLDAVHLSGRGVYVGGCLALWSVPALIVLCIISTASSDRR
jgi:hypothetical protein